MALAGAQLLPPLIDFSLTLPRLYSNLSNTFLFKLLNIFINSFYASAVTRIAFLPTLKLR